MSDPPLDLIVKNVRVVRPHRPAVEPLDSKAPPRASEKR